MQWKVQELQKLHLFFGKAQKLGISDIHINPAIDHIQLRIRQHGRMTCCQTLQPDEGRALTQRIKAQAQMNLAESRCPQDGRIPAHWPDHREVRVACHPTLYGENLVIRLFAQQQSRRIGELGVGPHTLHRLMSGLETEEGLILVCGPTGAGKTSTLHAMLNQIGAISSNVMTLEDPVEITLEGALQTDLSQLPKMDFAQGLRSLLRQDPDVVLVGEIRDRETAELAIEAAMTGHLVLASLHAADAQGALSRLDMLGLAPRRVLPHLRNLVCQRLIHRHSDGRRIPLMQIWTPNGSGPGRSGSTPITGEVPPMSPPDLWDFSACFQEALQMELLYPEDCPVWIKAALLKTEER